MWVTDYYINSALAGPKPGWRRVGQEAENYDIDILEIGEAWWRRTRKGKLILGHIILYLGREDDWHTDAVAMIISRKVEKHSLDASTHDQDCMMLATTQSTPNWKRGIEKKTPYYEHFRAATEEVPTYDMLLIVCDLNDRQEDNTGRDPGSGYTV